MIENLPYYRPWCLSTHLDKISCVNTQMAKKKKSEALNLNGLLLIRFLFFSRFDMAVSLQN